MLNEDLKNIGERGVGEVKKVSGFVKSGFSEFLDFVRKQGVVGLAVGIILGTAVTKLVASLVKDIINPLVSILLSKIENLNSLVWTIPGTTAELAIGNFFSSLIDFIIIAAVVYFGVKKLGLDKLDKSKS
jgi:large conductance mechanosensitive channel